MEEPAPEPLAGLIREHRATETFVSEVRAATGAATAVHRDEGAIREAMAQLQELNAYLAIELTIHIAKEEEILFPALLEMSDESPSVITDMLAQHEEIRAKQDALRQVLETIDATHEELRAERSRLSALLENATDAGGEVDRETLLQLRETVVRLDWILQGHFGDEEDGLFEPAAAWLSPAALEDLAGRMEALAREYS